MLRQIRLLLADRATMRNRALRPVPRRGGAPERTTKPESRHGSARQPGRTARRPWRCEGEPWMVGWTVRDSPAFCGASSRLRTSLRPPFPLSPCLPVSLSPCLPASLSPCLPVSLSPCLPFSLSPYPHLPSYPSVLYLLLSLPPLTRTTAYEPTANTRRGHRTA